MDDHHLASLLSATPSRCILLLEDIDCAFPSRDAGDESDDDDEQFDGDYMCIFSESMQHIGWELAYKMNVEFHSPTVGRGGETLARRRFDQDP